MSRSRLCWKSHFLSAPTPAWTISIHLSVHACTHACMHVQNGPDLSRLRSLPRLRSLSRPRSLRPARSVRRPPPPHRRPPSPSRASPHRSRLLRRSRSRLRSRLSRPERSCGRTPHSRVREGPAIVLPLRLRPDAQLPGPRFACREPGEHGRNRPGLPRPESSLWPACEVSGHPRLLASRT